MKANLDQEQSRFLAARENGDPEIAAVIVGEGIDLVRETLPAAEIVHRMVADAEAALRNGVRLLA